MLRGVIGSLFPVQMTMDHEAGGACFESLPELSRREREEKEKMLVRALESARIYFLRL